MTGGFAKSKSLQMGGEMIYLLFVFGGGERDCLNSAWDEHELAVAGELTIWPPLDFLCESVGFRLPSPA